MLSEGYFTSLAAAKARAEELNHEAFLEYNEDRAPWNQITKEDWAFTAHWEEGYYRVREVTAHDSS